MFRRLLVLSALVAAPLLAQTNDRGIVLTPRKVATINLADAAKRPHPPPAKPRKPENDVTIPHDLPVPPGAIGKRFVVTTPPSPPPKTPESVPPPAFPVLIGDGVNIPPDCAGAVGPNHVMAMHNSGVRIQDKRGTELMTVSLENFFPPAVTSSAIFDPRVLYDRFADRWIVAAPTDSHTAFSTLLVSVSHDGNPLGMWTSFLFTPDPAGRLWFDFPSIGINRNWFVISGNLYRVDNNAFIGDQLYIFDKAALYAGTARPRVMTRSTSEGGIIVPAITLDDSENTEYLASDWSGSAGTLRLFTITGTPSAPSFTPTMLFPSVTSSWAFSNDMAQSDFAPQMGSTRKIATNDSRMHDVVVRNGSLWCAQTAFLPSTTPTHTALQWWQIDPLTASVRQFGRVEDGTQFFAFPSIAVNAYDDALLGYSNFSPTQFASCSHSLRLHSDAPNTMESGVLFRAGLASYFLTLGMMRNRWGDYSSTVIDPDDFSMWTLQEYASTPVSGTDRWGTEWTQVVPPVPNVFIKDRPEDSGAEPNASTLPMWESDDIWLRTRQDSAHVFAHMTENAVFGGPNFVYVEVRNRGGAPSSGTEQLTLYWAKASSGLSWPDPWNGGVHFDPPANTMPAGDIIGTMPLPAIGPGSNAILEFPWSPPDPNAYTPLFGTDQGHFCLLARITSGTTPPFGMTFPEVTGDLNGNVQRNNRIAWKNIEIDHAGGGMGAPARIVVANRSDKPMRIHLRVELLDASGRPLSLKNRKVVIAPIDALQKLTFFTAAVPNDRFTLGPGQFGSVKVEVVPAPSTSDLLRVTQLEVTAGGERVVGGVTIVYR